MGSNYVIIELEHSTSYSLLLEGDGVRIEIGLIAKNQLSDQFCIYNQACIQILKVWVGELPYCEEECTCVLVW